MSNKKDKPHDGAHTMHTGNKILIIAAHPDDEVLGVGGATARLTTAGKAVDVVFLATGAAARHADLEADSATIKAEIDALKENAAATKGVLGISEQFFLDYPDNRLDTVPLMDITHALRDIVIKTKPDTVFTHHYGDYNWDHRVAFEATMMACRANAGEFYPSSIYTYEVLSSTERSPSTSQHAFMPTTYVDITETIDRKIAALKCYTTELGEFPHPRSPEAVSNKALCRGSEVNLHHAEAFQLIRSIQ